MGIKEIGKNEDLEFVIDQLVEHEVPVGDHLRDALYRLEEALKPPTSSRSSVATCSMASIWPAKDVVSKLVDASDILLDELNYDGHGWEQLHSAREEARKFLKQ